jgi:hypothetical protein
LIEYSKIMIDCRIRKSLIKQTASKHEETWKSSSKSYSNFTNFSSTTTICIVSIFLIIFNFWWK